MFKIVKEKTFTRTVSVHVPVDGGYETETIAATFKVVPIDESRDLDDPVQATAFLRDVVVRLDDLVDDDKKPLPYNDALRDQLIATPYVRLALVRDYIEAISKVRAGN